MGFLNFIVLAKTAEVQEVADSNPPTRWDCSPETGLADPSGLEALYALLAGATSQDERDALEESLFEQYVESRADPDAFAHVLPEDLTARLGGLANEQIPALADAWAASDELRSFGVDRAQAERVLLEARRLARAARERELALISWLGE